MGFILRSGGDRRQLGKVLAAKMVEFEPMETKKKAPRKTQRVTVRFSEKEFHKLRWLAETYAGKNIAAWLRFAALEAPRKFLK